MQIFFLSAALLAAAAILWYTQAAGRDRGMSHPPELPSGEACPAEPDECVMDGLETAVDAMWAVMEHPVLGGPGFITVRLPQQEEGGALVVTAQYPNIRERLYCRVVRQELERETLLAEGVPEALLALSPGFEADSGGVVLLSVRILGGEAVRRAAGFRERRAMLDALAAGLRRRYPDLSVRCVGGELLLNRVCEAERS